MHRIITVLGLLALVGVSTANAWIPQKEVDPVGQKKAPLEERINQTAPELRDSLETAVPEENGQQVVQPSSGRESAPHHGVWQPALAE